jgi:hypothetical protein
MDTQTEVDKTCSIVHAPKQFSTFNFKLRMTEEEREIYLDSIAESESLVVFIFGNKGTGKTAFLLAMYRYLLSLGEVYLNPKTNPDGYRFMNRINKDWSMHKMLPNASDAGKPKEVDVEVIIQEKKESTSETAKKRHLFFTFVDVSGENFKILDPTLADSETQRYELDKNTRMYLEHEGIKLAILAFVDYTNLELSVGTKWGGVNDSDSQAVLLNGFLEYLRQNFYDKYVNCGLLVSKWDKVPKNTTLEQIYDRSDDLKQAQIRITQMRNGRDFPFSIGETKPTDAFSLQNNALNLKYCQAVMDWLIEINKDYQDVPPYHKPSLWQRIVLFFRNIFSKKQP